MAGNVSYNFGQHATKEKSATFAKSYNDEEVSDINSSSFKMTTPMPNFERIFLPLHLPNQICKRKSYYTLDQFSPSVFPHSVMKFMSHTDVCECLVHCSVAGACRSARTNVHTYVL